MDSDHAAHPADTVIILPCSRGGIGFFSGNWRVSDGKLYAETIRLLDQCLSDYPDASLLAALMQHGERDGTLGNHLYLWDAMELVASIRARYGTPTLPFVFGEPGPLPTFTGNNTASHEIVRSQTRALPSVLPHVATSREEDPTAFDALPHIGDGLHFDRPSQVVLGGLDAAALATATTSVALPDVTNIFNTSPATIAAWSGFGLPCGADDRWRASDAAPGTDGRPDPPTGPGCSQLHAGVDPRVRVAAGIVVVECRPLGGDHLGLAGAGRDRLSAGHHAGEAAQGALSLSLSSGLPGTVAILAYAVDSAQTITFTGDGSEVVSGEGPVASTSYTIRESVEVESSASLGLTPSVTPDRVCGALTVALG